MKSIIFDLDLTLIDSSIAEEARRNRDWQKVYSMIPHFKLYDGMLDVFRFIRENKIKVCIVSTAPGAYINKVVSHFRIPCDHIVDYFSAKPIKPDPSPMLKALELLDEIPSNVVSFGDRAIDIQSSNAAEIESVACLWGTNEESLLRKSNCKRYLTQPIEIVSAL
jgi:phosphoglycolate phosphatase-like HAD superfamily hydrolase